MVFAAIVCFMLAALFGIVLITYVWQGRRPPKLLAITHGSFAFLGLLSVVISAFSTSILWISASILFLAACGGIYLFSHHLRKEKIPRLVATLHGMLAITGLAVLIITVFILYT